MIEKIKQFFINLWNGGKWYALVFICGLLFGFIIGKSCGCSFNRRGVSAVDDNIGYVRDTITAAENAVDRSTEHSRQLIDRLTRIENSVDKLQEGSYQFARILGQIQKRQRSGTMDLPGRDSDTMRRYYLFGN